MPKYTLLRAFDPDMTRAELDGMALASMATLATYMYRGTERPQTSDHGIRWIRSYWEPGGTWGMCLFEAPDLAVLSDYQDLCGTGFIEGREVVEIEGPTLGAGADATRVAVSMRLGRGEESSPPDLLADLSAMTTADDGQTRFARAYWCDETRTATALFETSTPEHFEQRIAPVAERQPARIVELRPDDYR